MCFSPGADAASAAVIAPVAVAALRAARARSELVLAALPALFVVHQLLSAVVWLGQRGDVGEGTAHAAAIAYLLYAQAALPVLVPLAFLLLEPDRRRRTATAALLAVGVVLGSYLLMTIVARPVDVQAADHVVVYTTDTANDGLVAAAYLLAVCGPALLSGRPLLRAFGAVNVVGFAVAAIVREEAVTSIWCSYAALASVLVWLALRGQRADSALVVPRVR